MSIFYRTTVAHNFLFFPEILQPPFFSCPAAAFLLYVHTNTDFNNPFSCESNQNQSTGKCDVKKGDFLFSAAVV